MIAFKFLQAGSVGLFSGLRWPQPDGGEPGDWVEAGGELEECAAGVHACRLEHIPYWIDDELWRIELAGELIERERLVLAERGRLVVRVGGWDAEAARDFAGACAWRARDQAARRLRQAGLDEEAAELERAAGLDEVEERAAALARLLAGEPATAAAFAADAVALVCGRRPEAWDPHPAVKRPPAQSPGATASNLGFVAAHAAGSEAAAAGADYGEAFAAERAWQLAWLSERLQLEP